MRGAQMVWALANVILSSAGRVFRVVASLQSVTEDHAYPLRSTEAARVGGMGSSRG